ncbi:MAG: type II toxin-antitoxin system RelE/ParE family toxin [Sphingomonadales bacterium]|nr:type II toxin-antitoxin system RelE/ParE family toxin [Sphingomonadales bacterium]
MIKHFKCRHTEEIWNRRQTRKFGPDIGRVAYRKLIMLDSALNLLDLRSPPGNRLEALSGDRKGQHSIRINDQFRVCFVWRDGNAHEVEIVDYH